MKFAKIDPITGGIVATGEGPDSEPLADTDHEGFLLFPYEGELVDYRFDAETREFVRTDQADVADLRRRLALEKRAPTPEELTALGLG